jgi:hypothetical protein
MSPVELFADDLSTYPLETDLGMRFGPWALTTFHFSWRPRENPFRVVEQEGRRFLEEPQPRAPFYNGVLRAGEPEWRNYTIELDLAVSDGPGGPIVRYQTSRRHYFVCLEVGQPLRLYRRSQDDHVVIAVANDFRAEKDRLYRVRVTCEGSRFSVAVDDQPLIEVEDDTYSHGAIALRAEGSTRFGAVKVLAEAEEAERLTAEARRTSARLAREVAAIPGPKLIHTAVLPAKPRAAHRFRVQDVNGDGALELIGSLPQETGPFPKASKLCAFSWQGEPLWELEAWAETENGSASADWLDVGDIDGDGCVEVIVSRGLEILVVEAATGQIKRRMHHPSSAGGTLPLSYGARIHGGLIANLRGLPQARDLLLKDEYENLWAYTDELELLWHREINTGHLVYARDIDGDGKDEVMGGYSLLNPDGTTRWTVPGGDPLRDQDERPPWPPSPWAKPPLTTDSAPEFGSQHNDRTLIEAFEPGPDAPMRVAIAASDLGFLLLDVEGNLLAHHRIGHAQWITSGRFRPDLPGRQIAVGTFWGNSNILNIFDCYGNLLRVREPGFGPMQSFYWQGRDAAPLIVSARGVYNQHLERVAEFPDGGSLVPVILDVNGDGRDELFVLVGNEFRVYTADR